MDEPFTLYQVTYLKSTGHLSRFYVFSTDVKAARKKFYQHKNPYDNEFVRIDTRVQETIDV